MTSVSLKDEKTNAEPTATPVTSINKITIPKILNLLLFLCFLGFDETFL